MSKIALRNAWFQVHKWIGLLLAIAIIPICISGSILVWHDAIDAQLNPERAYAGAPILPVERYAAAATAAARPGEALMSIEIPTEGAVVASLAQPPKPGAGRPVRTMLWLAGDDARLLDRANSDAGMMRFMHVLHGTLFIPEWGRATVGWVGVFMAISCLSGIWLWWPTVGAWVRGLRWRRHNDFNNNLHHQLGFWILLPLFALSVTGFWISFPKVFADIGQPAAQGGRDAGPKGDGARAKGTNGRGGGEPSRAARMRARPLDNPAISLNAALAAAGQGRVARVGWPTDVEPQWNIRTGPEDRAQQTEVKVDAASGAAEVKPPKNEPESLNRLMRRIHDGTDMGLFWQMIIFLGGILPAILSVTGIIMWWRARKWRGELARRQAAKLATA